LSTAFYSYAGHATFCSFTQLLKELFKYACLLVSVMAANFVTFSRPFLSVCLSIARCLVV
jgi:hypothetical protein